jgi:hypothetical protein
MKIETTHQFTLTETEARALHDLIAEMTLNEHRRLLASPSLGKPSYNGTIEEAHDVISHMYVSLHNVLAK